MATERQSPDVLLDQTNLSGAVAAIQDDPDTPDASWLTAISNNADSVCRTSFPIPTGNPTVGADLQQFKIWVRKMGGSGTPTVRIELYENNVFLATLLADTGVTNTSGVLHSGAWNANLLGTADGSLVECRVYGTKSGGSPSARAAIEVGAVEWNVTYTSGVTELLVGTVTGGATINGNTKIRKAIIANSAGTASIVSIARISRKIAGLSPGSVSIVGTIKPIRGITGVVSGIATIVGTISTGAIHLLVGVVGGGTAVNGAIRVIKKLIVLVVGITSSSGAIKILRCLSAVVLANSAVVGSIQVAKKFVAACAGSAFAIGSLTLSAATSLLAGFIAGVASVTAILCRLRRIYLVTSAEVSPNLTMELAVTSQRDLITNLGVGLIVMPLGRIGNMDFEIGETIICSVEVKDKDGNYIDPDTSIKVNIAMPQIPYIEVVAPIAMIKDAVGKYHYDFSTSSLLPGVYRISYIVENGTRVTKESEVIRLV